MAINTYFKNIADAIREKTGDTGLITPGNMPDEIRNIQTSGGLIEPLHYDVNNGCYLDGNCVLRATYNNTNNYYDVYNITSQLTNIIIGLGDTISNRCRIAFFTNNPANVIVTSDMYQQIIYSPNFVINNSDIVYSYMKFIDYNHTGFLVVGKTNNGTSGIKTYCYHYPGIIGV